MSVRFAPSPTGRFHIGNLRTAWISFQWAKALKMPWVLRFEDIDKARVVAGAMDEQLADMRTLGMEGATAPQIQSQSFERHWELFRRALNEEKIYPCFCTRKEIQNSLASAPHQNVSVYSGQCRRNLAPLAGTKNETIAWRFRNKNPSGADDFIVGRTASVAAEVYSFVPSYQWACAIDDYDGDHRLLVRAWDLADSLTQQRDIFSLLCEWQGTRVLPAVFHTTLLLQNDRHRLEKRTLGVTLTELLKAGMTPQRILKLFEDSFDLNLEDFAPSKVFGEELKLLTLEQLGLT